MPNDSLKKTTVKGVGWSFADNISSSGITFLVGLILARILTPKEYGLIGIITIFIAVFNSIVDSGFSNALIRKKEADNTDYNTVFIFNLLLSVVLFSILYVCAPLIADFFNQPELIPLTRVMGVIVIINAFAIIQRTLLVKKIDFRTQTKVSLIASISSGIVGIGMALSGLGVWSLVGQQITRQLLNTVFLWLFSRWRPVWQFSKTSFQSLFSFGWKLLVSGLIDTIWRELYLFIIGKFYTAESLGQYTRAQQFNSIFSSNLTAVVQRVSYPVLSSIQDENDRLREAYRKIIKTTMLASFTCMLGLAAIAKPMVLVLIGAKWLPSVAFLQIICFSGMLYPLQAINLNMLQVKGRSDLFLKLEIIKKTIMIGPVALGIFIGIKWMLWGSVGTSFISYYLNSYYSGAGMNYSTLEQVKDILPSFGVASLTALIVFGLSFLSWSPFVVLPLQLVVGLVIFVVLCENFKLKEYYEVKTIVMNVVKVRKHG